MMKPGCLEWYMRLVDALEKTAREYDAPPEMIEHMAALTAIYVHKRPQKQVTAH
jgi:hypothetical protein